MRRFWKISVVYALCFLLIACIGSLPPRPWFEGDKDWPSIDRFQVEIEGKRESFEFATKIHYVDESTTWIYLYVNDFKRASAPLRYSARDAYIEKENGERITPKLYITSSNAKDIPPGLPWGGKIPDVTVQEKTVDPSNSGDSFGGINFRFDTPPPNAKSRCVLHLGQVTVGDVGVEIPEKVIIVRGRQWYSVPIQ